MAVFWCSKRFCPHLVLLLALWSPGPGVLANERPLKIVIPPLEDTASAHAIYFPRLLHLALGKTELTHGPYVIEHYPELLTNGRFLADLKYGRTLDVMWSTTDAQRERELRAIPISLMRGLNSHRVCLIRAEDRELFENIESLEQLRRLRAGVGQHWPDTEIMLANQLPTVTSAHYELLFSMLAGKRFDYFPRGLYEVWDEYKMHQERGLIIEPTLMLQYPAPIYFFVNREDRALAERIELGLNLAQMDGSLDELFFSIPSFRWGYEEMLNPQRTILRLKLPESFPEQLLDL